MREGISGRGQLWYEGAYLCAVAYEIEGETGEGDAPFTFTDGVITVDKVEAQDPAVRKHLEPYEQLELRLGAPLADGRKRLPIIIEPYAGHRPDERYQIRLRD